MLPRFFYPFSGAATASHRWKALVPRSAGDLLLLYRLDLTGSAVVPLLARENQHNSLLASNDHLVKILFLDKTSALEETCITGIPAPAVGELRISSMYLRMVSSSGNWPLATHHLFFVMNFTIKRGETLKRGETKMQPASTITIAEAGCINLKIMEMLQATFARI